MIMNQLIEKCIVEKCIETCKNEFNLHFQKSSNSMLFSLRYGCNVYIFHQLRDLDQQTIERLNGTNICISHYREREERGVCKDRQLYGIVWIKMTKPLRMSAKHLPRNVVHIRFDSENKFRKCLVSILSFGCRLQHYIHPF